MPSFEGMPSGERVLPPELKIELQPLAKAVYVQETRQSGTPEHAAKAAKALEDFKVAHADMRDLIEKEIERLQDHFEETIG